VLSVYAELAEAWYHPDYFLLLLLRAYPLGSIYPALRGFLPTTALD